MKTKHRAFRSRIPLPPVLLLALMGIGCGVDDPGTNSSASPTPEAVSAGAPAESPSTASLLPPPAPATAPVATVANPATTDEPPPLAPGTDASGVALAQSMARRMPTPTVLRTAIASGLEEPTDLAVLADGTVFFTQRRRGLFVQRAGEGTARVLFAPAASAKGSAAMLAVAVDPAFERNRHVFVYVQGIGATSTDGSVIRLVLDDAASRVLDQRTVVHAALRGAPTADDPLRSTSALRFGPDGYLYVGIGDRAVPEAAQSTQTLAGKVLRIDRDGHPASGNHIADRADPRVFAIGLRQPAAIAFHPANETLLVGERRSAQPDEIILVNPGANAGWDPRCAASLPGYCDRHAEQREAARPVGTVSSWRGDKAAEGLAAMAPLRGEHWGTWQNGIAVAFERAQRLDLLKLDGQGRVTQSVTALERAGVGFRAVAQGPDGLYVATSGKPGGDQIWRLSIR